MNKLKIFDPSAKELDFIIGESRIVKYKVINESDFQMKDLEFNIETVLKDQKEIKKTVNDYAKIVESPDIIYPGVPDYVKVLVNIPKNYNETVTKADGSTVVAPFRLRLKGKGLEFIEEI
jgi:hypothetical protein